YAFDPILSPVVAETVVTKDNARLSYNLKMMVRWVTLLGLPLFVAMIVFGDVLLTLWGPSYSEAFPALIILAIGHLVNAVLGLHQWPIVMSGRSKLDLFNNALAFAINIILNIVLIPIWGLAGAATATLVGNIVFRSLQAIQVGIIFRIHAFSIYWLRILVAVGLAVAVQIGIRVLVVGPPGFIVFLFATLIGMVVYFFVYLALGATPEDKQIVSRIMGRFRRKQ
ncbi:MAG: polysaccharide biosynthesis C-terminal domain-containing protein, partial [Deltaproteobacteria bacterium]|nr:polysaccharide biosynthesis C-terminal domain-containing protein [Deltaproteobacteria bacterium]